MITAVVAFMFWVGLKLGQNLSRKDYDDFEL